MQYTRKIEDAAAMSESAMKRIADEGLPPTPEIFELWYSFIGKEDPDLCREVEKIEEEGGKFDFETCLELHRRFLSNLAETERVKTASDTIQDTIKAVTDMVSGVKSATSEYNQSLESVTGSLSEGADSEEVQKVLGQVLASTKEMMAQNQKLEEELVKSAGTMQELEKEMETVRKEAMTDGLTGLSNRKSFDTYIERMVPEAHNAGTAITLLLLDIDHFKKFNDTHGHQVGDQVLRLVAQTLKNGVKGRDVAARYGGEEFAIILPETNLAGGIKVADSLRMSVAGKELVNKSKGNNLGKITLSGGVAEYQPGERIDSLIERADAALYSAKNNGRNQIVAAHQKTPQEQEKAKA